MIFLLHQFSCKMLKLTRMVSLDKQIYRMLKAFGLFLVGNALGFLLGLGFPAHVVLGQNHLFCKQKHFQA